ncbi:protein STAY-GREEN homolog, chloroplastic-like [Magnolia sinica]|uniref:protein STAY-GREEN homolog, chloroplastic-like n=1 Tax=Magnolia sinica TaxID=86752 RepID=UPI0026593A76|nr:protein STAY-GREEN homolog, chloroplastic-like [Magnolia sinica]
MAFAASFLLPTLTKPHPTKRRSSFFLEQNQNKPKTRRSVAALPVARLFGPTVFESSKLSVMLLGVDEEKHPGSISRTYTLTHCDISSKLTLTISQTINQTQLQGWYHRFQRDEVVAEWKKIQGLMSLHVHCHISGQHFFLDLIANLRRNIFRKELPVVLKAIAHGDGHLFRNYPELKETPVWVYFHSNLAEYNQVECWGPLKDAASEGGESMKSQFGKAPKNSRARPRPCRVRCTCCFPKMSLIPWPLDFDDEMAHQCLEPAIRC